MTAPSAFRRDAAGQAAHYGFGVLAEYWSQATTAAGAPSGLAAAAPTEEAAVPLASLGSPPCRRARIDACLFRRIPPRLRHRCQSDAKAGAIRLVTSATRERT